MRLCFCVNNYHDSFCSNHNLLENIYTYVYTDYVMKYIIVISSQLIMNYYCVQKITKNIYIIRIYYFMNNNIS